MIKLKRKPMIRMPKRSVAGIGLRGSMIIAMLLFVSCSGKDSSPPETNTSGESSGHSRREWAEMLLRPTDSTRLAWMEGMSNWPAEQQLTVDANGRAQIADLEFAFHTWIVKNLDFGGDTLLGGLRLSITVAATHIPDHQLMTDFSIDSVLLFKPGEDVPAVRKVLFPARRKYLEGVWQVAFVQEGHAVLEPDFPEATQFLPRAFVSWKNKKIVFQMPLTAYEYVQSPASATG